MVLFTVVKNDIEMRKTIRRNDADCCCVTFQNRVDSLLKSGFDNIKHFFTESLFIYKAHKAASSSCRRNGHFCRIHIEYQAYVLFRLACSGDNQTAVITKGVEPSLNVRGRVAEGIRRFDSQLVHENGRAHLRDQFFFGVILAAEECTGIQAVQAACVTGGVGDLMKGCGVIFRNLRELLAQRKYDTVRRRTVERAVLLFISDRHPVR